MDFIVVGIAEFAVAVIVAAVLFYRPISRLLEKRQEDNSNDVAEESGTSATSDSNTAFRADNPADMAEAPDSSATYGERNRR